APVTAADGKTTFSALIPSSLPLGDYTLCASFTGANGTQWYTVPVLGDSGRLQVVDAAGATPVQVTSVPRVVYEKGERYSFSVLGNGFSRVGADTVVLLNGIELPLCWDNNASCSRNTALAKGSVISTHQLALDLPASLKNQYIGSQSVQVRVGE